jgi:hypothetical protein
MSQEAKDPGDEYADGGTSGGRAWIRWIVIGALIAGSIAAVLYTVFLRGHAPVSDPSIIAIQRETIPEDIPEPPQRPDPPAPVAETPSASRPMAQPAGPAIGNPPSPVPQFPNLDTSDRALRSALSLLSEQPQLSSWLLNDDLLRRFVVSVDNVAEGKAPSRHLEFMKPATKFETLPAGELYRADPSSYSRYDLIADVFTSLDVDGAAEIYFDNEALLSEAYRELGYPDESFHKRLAAAFAQLLGAPILYGEPEFELLIVTYGFADMRLEELTPVQKLFLRMGADNVRRVQVKLRVLADALGIPAEGLPKLRVHTPDSYWYPLEPGQ